MLSRKMPPKPKKVLVLYSLKPVDMLLYMEKEI
jgi:hypothetical protein